MNQTFNMSKQRVASQSYCKMTDAWDTVQLKVKYRAKEKIHKTMCMHVYVYANVCICKCVYKFQVVFTNRCMHSLFHISFYFTHPSAEMGKDKARRRLGFLGHQSSFRFNERHTPSRWWVGWQDKAEYPVYFSGPHAYTGVYTPTHMKVHHT